MLFCAGRQFHDLKIETGWHSATDTVSSVGKKVRRGYLHFPFALFNHVNVCKAKIGSRHPSRWAVRL